MRAQPYAFILPTGCNTQRSFVNFIRRADRRMVARLSSTSAGTTVPAADERRSLFALTVPLLSDGQRSELVELGAIAHGCGFATSQYAMPYWANIR
jgi:hypothetical protein